MGFGIFRAVMSVTVMPSGVIRGCQSFKEI